MSVPKTGKKHTKNSSKKKLKTINDKNHQAYSLAKEYQIIVIILVLDYFNLSIHLYLRQPLY